MSGLGLRIKQARERKGYSQGKLGALVKVAQSTVAAWEKGINEPTLDVIQRVADATETDPVWLTFAIAPQPDEAETEQVLEREARGGMGAGGFAATIHDVTDEFGNTTSADAVTGVWRLPVSYLRRELRASPDKVNIIEVQGDSMDPTLQSGDRIMVDTAQRVPSPPGIFALWDGLAVIVKRLEYISRSDPPRVKIISDNLHHEAYTLTTGEINIIGRVVWYARKM